jgi:hypothetical protein
MIQSVPGKATNFAARVSLEKAEGEPKSPGGLTAETPKRWE